MLEEKLRLLEEKVVYLLGELKRLREENATLKSKFHALEGESAKAAERETEIRERLRSIIEKIDAIEQLSSGQ